MKKRGMRLILISVMFLLALPLVYAQYSCGSTLHSLCSGSRYCGSANLIQNGGFEVDADSNNVPDGFIPDIRDPSRVSIDRREAYRGSNSVRVSGTWRSIDFPVNLERSEYIFSAMVKGSCMDLRVFYGNPGSGAANLCAGKSSGRCGNVTPAEGWKRIALEFNAAALPRQSSSMLRLECAENGRTFWIDSMALERKPGSQAEVALREDCGTCGCQTGFACRISGECAAVCRDGTRQTQCNADRRYCGSSNLITNGGFEADTDGNGIPDGYAPDTRSNFQSGALRLDNTEAFSGQNSIRITRQWGSFDAVNPIAIEPDAGYIFTAKVKGRCNDYRLYATDRSGNIGLCSLGRCEVAGEGEWRTFRAVFRLGSSSLNSLRVECAEAAPEFRVDSMALEKAAATQAEVALRADCNVCGCGEGEACISNRCQRALQNRASIKIAADDEFELYFNEVMAGSGEWSNVYDSNVPLQPGANTIAVIGRDSGDREGLVFEVTRGGEVIAKSDNSVKARLRTGMTAYEAANWKKAGFDDSRWEVTRQNHERRKSAAEGLGFSEGLFIWGRETHASRLDGEGEGYAFRKEFDFNAPAASSLESNDDRALACVLEHDFSKCQSLPTDYAAKRLAIEQYSVQYNEPSRCTDLLCRQKVGYYNCLDTEKTECIVRAMREGGIPVNPNFENFGEIFMERVRMYNRGDPTTLRQFKMRSRSRSAEENSCSFVSRHQSNLYGDEEWFSAQFPMMHGGIVRGLSGNNFYDIVKNREQLLASLQGVRDERRHNAAALDYLTEPFFMPGPSMSSSEYVDAIRSGNVRGLITVPFFEGYLRCRGSSDCNLLGRENGLRADLLCGNDNMWYKCDQVGIKRFPTGEAYFCDGTTWIPIDEAPAPVVMRGAAAPRAAPAASAPAVPTATAAQPQPAAAASQPASTPARNYYLINIENAETAAPRIVLAAQNTLIRGKCFIAVAEGTRRKGTLSVSPTATWSRGANLRSLGVNFDTFSASFGTLSEDRAFGITNTYGNLQCVQEGEFGGWVVI